MDALSALQFVRPQWLWALAALPLLAWWWRRRDRRAEAWREAVDPHLLPHLLEQGGGRGCVGLALLLCGWVLAVAALAGPSWRSVVQPLHAIAAPIVVVLDLSSSTAANDLPPSRLAQARTRIAELLRSRDGGQVGMVVFAEDAFTVAPLTEDAANVALFLDALQPEIMPVDGSRPSRGIGRAAMLLRQAGFARGEILLLASDDDGQAVAAARDAAAAGYRVSVLGLGDAGGASFRRRNGEIARSRLDAPALRAVAAAGGGGYQPLAPGDIAALGLADTDTGDGSAPARSGSVRIAQDGGFWLLPLLMLLALPAFRRGVPVALLVLAVGMPAPPALAQSSGPPAALAAHPPQGSPWLRADQAAHRQAQRAEDAYRAGDFAGAARGWEGLPGADAAYNRGNALARTGRYEDALAAYDQAIAGAPGHADAVANRAAVAAAMQRKPPPGPRDGSRGAQSPQDDAGKPQPDPQAGEAGDSGAQGDADAARGDAGEPSSSPPPPRPGEPQEPRADPPAASADAEQAQRAADAAQRARMRQAEPAAADADGPASDGDRRDGDPDRAESAADRERRRAQEAWLRRVPDDPGGLLRARFLLEHERRQRDRSD